MGVGFLQDTGYFQWRLGLRFPSRYIRVVLDRPGTGFSGCHFEMVLSWQVTHVSNSHEL